MAGWSNGRYHGRGVHDGCGQQHEGPDVAQFDKVTRPEGRVFRHKKTNAIYHEAFDDYFGLCYLSNNDMILPAEKKDLLVEIFQ
jgi:hypothetical protein